MTFPFNMEIFTKFKPFIADIALWSFIGVAVFGAFKSVGSDLSEPLDAPIQEVTPYLSEMADLDGDFSLSKTYESATLLNIAKIKQLYADTRIDYEDARTPEQRRLLRRQMMQLIQAEEFSMLRLFNLTQNGFWNAELGDDQ